MANSFCGVLCGNKVLSLWSVSKGLGQREYFSAELPFPRNIDTNFNKTVFRSNLFKVFSCHTFMYVCMYTHKYMLSCGSHDTVV